MAATYNHPTADLRRIFEESDAQQIDRTFSTKDSTMNSKAKTFQRRINASHSATTAQPAAEKAPLFTWQFDPLTDGDVEICCNTIPIARTPTIENATKLCAMLNQSAGVDALISVANGVKDWHAGPDDSSVTRAAIDAIRNRAIAALARVEELRK